MKPSERLKEIESKLTTNLPHYSHSDHAWLIARVKRLEIQLHLAITDLKLIAAQGDLRAIRVLDEIKRLDDQ